MQEMYSQEQSFEDWKKEALRSALTRSRLPEGTRVFWDSPKDIFNDENVFYPIMLSSFLVGFSLFSYCMIVHELVLDLIASGIAIAIVGSIAYGAYIIAESKLRSSKRRRFCVVGLQGIIVFKGYTDPETYSFEKITTIERLANLDRSSKQLEKLKLIFDEGEPKELTFPDGIKVDLDYILACHEGRRYASGYLRPKQEPWGEYGNYHSQD